MITEASPAEAPVRERTAALGPVLIAVAAGVSLLLVISHDEPFVPSRHRAWIVAIVLGTCGAAILSLLCRRHRFVSTGIHVLTLVASAAVVLGATEAGLSAVAAPAVVGVAATVAVLARSVKPYFSVVFAPLTALLVVADVSVLAAAASYLALLALLPETRMEASNAEATEHSHIDLRASDGSDVSVDPDITVEPAQAPVRFDVPVAATAALDLPPPPPKAVATAAPATPPPPSAIAEPPVTAAPSALDEYPVLGTESRANVDAPALPPQLFPYAHANVSDSYTLGKLELRGASRRGPSHAHGGSPRQDSYCLSGSADGRFAVVAVADGLGSAKLSHLGAFLASRVACAALTELLADSTIDEIEFADVFAQVATTMRTLAARMLGECEESELLTTLVVVIADSTTAEAVIARVGDSTVLVLENGEIVDAFDEPEPALVDSGTSALPSSCDFEWRELSLPYDGCLLVVSDGISRQVELSPAVVGEFFAERLRMAPTDIGFTRAIGFSRRGAHDDRTAVGLWRTDGDG